MNTPYGLEVSESCVDCTLRDRSCFCDLSPAVLRALSTVSHQATYPGGAVLFVEGQKPRGAFLLCAGRVKISTMSREGKVLILKIAKAGEPLGLSAVISGGAYEFSAEAFGPCQLSFVERESFLRLLQKHGELGYRSAQVLSQQFQCAYRDLHELVLSRSSAGRLARLLLSWTSEWQDGGREIRIRSSMTHEEMAQMIGASRETVTRVLSELKRRELIRRDGETLVIRDKRALEALAA